MSRLSSLVVFILALLSLRLGITVADVNNNAALNPPDYDSVSGDSDAVEDTFALEASSDGSVLYNPETVQDQNADNAASVETTAPQAAASTQAQQEASVNLDNTNPDIDTSADTDADTDESDSTTSDSASETNTAAEDDNSSSSSEDSSEDSSETESESDSTAAVEEESSAEGDAALGLGEKCHNTGKCITIAQLCKDGKRIKDKACGALQTCCVPSLAKKIVDKVTDLTKVKPKPAAAKPKPGIAGTIDKIAGQVKDAIQQKATAKPPLKKMEGVIDKIVDKVTKDLPNKQKQIPGGLPKPNPGFAPSTYTGTKCKAGTPSVLGVCMHTAECTQMGGWKSTPGKCPGPTDIQCCTPVGNFLYNPSKKAPCKFNSQIRGMCVPTAECKKLDKMTNRAGWCPGPDDIQCCFPTEDLKYFDKGGITAQDDWETPVTSGGAGGVTHEDTWSENHFTNSGNSGIGTEGAVVVADVEKCAAGGDKGECRESCLAGKELGNEGFCAKKTEKCCTPMKYEIYNYPKCEIPDYPAPGWCMPQGDCKQKGGQTYGLCGGTNWCCQLPLPAQKPIVAGSCMRYKDSKKGTCMTAEDCKANNGDGTSATSDVLCHNAKKVCCLV